MQKMKIFRRRRICRKRNKILHEFCLQVGKILRILNNWKSNKTHSASALFFPYIHSIFFNSFLPVIQPIYEKSRKFFAVCGNF